MINSWQKDKLKDICLKVTDGTHDSPTPIESGGYPLIKGKEISNGYIDFENCDRISEKDHLDVISRSKPEYEDTLFANIGNSIGDCVFVETKKLFSIKNIALFKPDKKKIYPKFLYYIVRSAQFQGEIKNKISGSAQPFASLNLLRNQKVKFPSLDEQKKITEYIEKFELLIQKNLDLINLLKKNLKYTFEEYFLRFKLNNQKLEIDENTKLPIGWKKVILTQYIDLVKGIEPGNSEYENEKTLENVPFIRVGDLSKRASNIYISKKKTGGILVSENEILISLDGSPGKVSFGKNGSYSSGIRKAVSKKKNLSNVFILNQLSSEYIKKLIDSHANGTTILHAGSAVKKMKFYLPTDEILDLYNESEIDKFNLIIKLLKENILLKEIFEIYYIRLMEGIIEIKDMN